MQIGYQGYLTTNIRQPVTMPTPFTFHLYAVPTGDSSVWEEMQTNTPVTNGVFIVMPGSVTPLTMATFDTARQLSVQAGTETKTTSRQAPGATPFALQVQQVNQLNPGGTVSGIRKDPYAEAHRFPVEELKKAFGAGVLHSSGSLAS